MKRKSYGENNHTERKKNKIYIWEKLDKEDNDEVNIKRKIIDEIVEETS